MCYHAGEGERQEVVFFSDPSHNNFVASKATKVTLCNLTLMQQGTCDGIVVVEAGQMTLEIGKSTRLNSSHL